MIKEFAVKFLPSVNSLIKHKEFVRNAIKDILFIMELVKLLPWKIKSTQVA
jgi:hypothetical protein